MPTLAPAYRVWSSTSKRSVSGPDDAPRHLFGLIGAGHLADDDELVAAEPRDSVTGADRASDPVRDLAQQRIAGGVTPGVVDQLEVVEVDEHHSDRAVALTLHTRQRLLETVSEKCAVGQAGQVIVHGAPTQLVLDAAHLGDVHDRGKPAGDLRVMQRRRRHVQDVQLAVRVLVLELIALRSDLGSPSDPLGGLRGLVT